MIKKQHIPVFLIAFFLILYAFRLADSFLLRTDQGPVGELFTHKIIRIALLIAAVKIFHQQRKHQFYSRYFLGRHRTESRYAYRYRSNHHVYHSVGTIFYVPERGRRSIILQ